MEARGRLLSRYLTLRMLSICSVILKSIVVICLFSLLTCGKHVHMLSVSTCRSRASHEEAMAT